MVNIINNINKIDSPHNCKLNGKMKKIELQLLGGVYYSGNINGLYFLSQNSNTDTLTIYMY